MLTSRRVDQFVDNNRVKKVKYEYEIEVYICEWFFLTSNNMIRLKKKKITELFKYYYLSAIIVVTCYG